MIRINIIVKLEKRIIYSIFEENKRGQQWEREQGLYTMRVSSKERKVKLSALLLQSNCVLG